MQQIHIKCMKSYSQKQIHSSKCFIHIYIYLKVCFNTLYMTFTDFMYDVYTVLFMSSCVLGFLTYV